MVTHSGIGIAGAANLFVWCVGVNCACRMGNTFSDESDAIHHVVQDFFIFNDYRNHVFLFSIVHFGYAVNFVGYYCSQVCRVPGGPAYQLPTAAFVEVG